MEAVRIDEHTWRIEDGFVRSFLLEGSEKALLLDTGASGTEAKAIAESLTSLPIVLLNTHGDIDHTAGNGEFSEYLIHPEDYKNCRMAEKYPNCKCVPIYGGETLDLGGRVLQIIAIPGHTYGSIAVLDEKNRYLFPGDTVQDGHIFLFGPHRVPKEFAVSLALLDSLSSRYDKVFASHGTPCLDSSAPRKVAADWAKVLEGSLTATVQNIFGFPAKAFTGSFCGFYCE